jgi:two-component system, chemotaxis family, CheB/CheR fusion protein
MTSRNNHPCPIVGMGASAGGFEAFQKFFAHMPPDTGMGFVLVQHLAPMHETLMPELLSKHILMPVEQVKDETLVERDRIYIIPPNATLTIEGGVIRVQSPESKDGLRMQIDRFLRSLAEDQGHNSVCILLSGTGSDGMLGLKAIKEQGGMAMAQEPATSRHDQMPRSAIGTGLVDHVLPVEQMPGVLVEYAKHLQAMQAPMIEHTIPRAEIEDSLRTICELLRLKTGHDFSRYKANTLVRRIQRRIQVLQASNLASYTERLRQDPEEAEQLLKDLLIGVTHFFRDPEAFEALAREAVSKILDRAEDGDDVRVWTPGCASGEEAYSVAILLREEMDRRHQRVKTQIFAGDIDEEALEVARLARYPEAIADHVSPERLERFFIKGHNFYQMSKDIREMCIFSTHNLVKDPPFSRLDLISCRNLLIYLGSELQHHVSLLFHYALRPGGFLFLGSSENMPAPTELFRTIDSKNRIFKRSETLLHPPLEFPFAERTRAARTTAAGHWGPRQQIAEQESNTQKLERLLLDTYSPAWVVITSEGETRYFSPRTGKYLEPPAGAPNMNVLSMARQGLRLDLRTALHKAIKTGESVLHQDVTVETNGEAQRINLIVRPLTDMGEGADLYLVVFQELGLPKHPGEEESRPVDHIAEQLESELRMTKEHLQATIEEVETSNEELKSSNEELLSTNEELQSANEELQTSKEELESINEELETINTELSKKVEELDHAHGEIRSLFQSTPFAIIYVDRALRIMHYTPPSTKIFSLIESDIGRPLTDIVPRFAEQDLIPSIREVLRTLAMHEREVQLADGSASYILRILPYLRHDNVVDGVILTFADVTDLKRSQLQHAQLAAIVESSADAIISRSLDGKIISWNPAAASLFDYSPFEAIGQPMTLIVPTDKIEEMEKVLSALGRGKTIPVYETVHIRKGGTRVPVQVTSFPLKDPKGTLVGVAANFHDISTLKRAEDALKEEVRQKDDFLAMLSHELRNPLAPLRSCLSVLNNSGSERDQEVAVEIMGRQLRQLETLVDQLLDTSRLSGNKLVLQIGDVDLVEVVRGVAEDLSATAAAREQELEVHLPGKPIWIGGDRVRLTQVVANVLHNASKFTESGGKIVITMRLEPNGHAALLTVRDTGIGMDQEMVSRLFQHFSQADHSIDRSRGGLGLGLSLSKKLLEAHGGTIEGRSDGPNQGSEFTIRIPVDPNRTPPPRPQRLAATPDRKKSISRRVLLIEDNPDGLMSTKMMLEVFGHEVATAPDAIQGLEVARKIKPEVILCDIGLPGGMDGYQFAREIRQDKGLRKTFMVALTGYGWESDQRQAQEAGFDSHLIKPAHLDSLQRLLVNLSDR